MHGVEKKYTHHGLGAYAIASINCTTIFSHPVVFVLSKLACTEEFSIQTVGLGAHCDNRMLLSTM